MWDKVGQIFTNHNNFGYQQLANTLSTIKTDVGS